MEWEVTGASQQTGKDVRVVVEGDTAEEAARAARDLGLYVSSTRPRMPAQSPAAASSPIAVSEHHPMGSKGTEAGQRGVVTTQRTGKLWKLAQLVGGVMLLVGGPLCVLGITTAYDAGGVGDEGVGIFGLGLLLVIVGLPTLILARIGAWWFHG